MAYTKDQLVSALFAAADRYGIDRDVAYYQINRESGFNPMAQSAVAKGIAQFTPDTAARFGLKDPFDPMASFEAWGQYMRFLLDMFGNRYDLALAGYNSGEKRAEYANALKEGREINWALLPAGVQNETKPYVETILKQSGYNAGQEPTISFDDSTSSGASPDLSTTAAGFGGLGVIALGVLAFLLLKR